MKDENAQKSDIYDIANTKNQYSCVAFLADASHIITGAGLLHCLHRALVSILALVLLHLATLLADHVEA